MLGLIWESKNLKTWGVGIGLVSIEMMGKFWALVRGIRLLCCWVGIRKHVLGCSELGQRPQQEFPTRQDKKHEHASAHCVPRLGGSAERNYTGLIRVRPNPTNIREVPLGSLGL